MVKSNANRTLLLCLGLLFISCTPTQGETHRKDSRNITDQAMNKDLIAAVALLDYENYRAKTVYNAVAGLMSLSKADALSEIETYLSEHPEAQSSIGLFILLRSLIEVGDDEVHPPMRLGKPDLDPPAQSSSLPLFPCVMVQDVPFLMVRGYALGGLPESVEDHLKFYRSTGSIRKTLKEYPDSRVEIEGEFSRKWDAAYGTEVPRSMIEMIQRQFGD
jgi:hypothetical protein